jgi:two-component system response regulator MtrA
MDDRPLVLIVHPDGEARISLYSLLEREGFRMATCASGTDALKYVCAQKPDVVLASTHLADFGPREFLAEIGRVSLNTPTMLVARPDDGESLVDVPAAVDRVPWPGRKSEILSSIRRLLESVSARRV